MSGKKGKFNPYTRSSLANKKQPVILSASEKKYIDDKILKRVQRHMMNI